MTGWVKCIRIFLDVHDFFADAALVSGKPMTISTYIVLYPYSSSTNWITCSTGKTGAGSLHEGDQQGYKVPVPSIKKTICDGVAAKKPCFIMVNRVKKGFEGIWGWGLF